MRPTAIMSFMAFLSALTVLPSMADSYRWPGSVGGAAAAKVIGERCAGSLSNPEIAEIDAYLAKARSEWATTGSNLKFDDLLRTLMDTYAATYSQAEACNASATEEARKTLQLVRKAMASGKPILPDSNSN
jgi:hypothetical protein